MKMLMIISSLISINIIYMYHPIMIMISIISQAIIISLLLYLISPTAWFSFTLFLIFIGGLMVLFIYITSLAANEMFQVKYKNYKTQATLSLIIFMMSSIMMFKFTSTQLLPSLFNQTSMIFSDLLPLNTMAVMSYLLITMIVVIKISMKINGPIRNIIKRL